MSKIKYLLFIIPFLFLFITKANAFTIININDVDITEQHIKDFIYTQDTSFDLYDYVVCYNNTVKYLRCFFLTEEQKNGLYTDGTNYDAYGNFLKFVYGLTTYAQYTNSNGTETFNSSTINTLKFSFYEGNKTGRTYTSFLNSDMTTYLGSTDYNALVFSSSPPPEPEPIISNLIYLPIELQEGNCPVILDKDTIRVYDEEPQINVSATYTDYFINSHYLQRNGTETLTDTISCLSLDNFTTAYAYRFDFDKII